MGSDYFMRDREVAFGLSQASTDELEAELKRRRKKELEIPDQRLAVDDLKLRQMLQGYLETVKREEFEDDDWEHSIYEMVIQTYYDTDEVFRFIRKATSQ